MRRLVSAIAVSLSLMTVLPIVLNVRAVNAGKPAVSVESIPARSQPINRAVVLFNWGLKLTQSQRFQRAIATLDAASEQFAQQGDAKNAYKSEALARYLEISIKHRQSPPGSHSLPNPYSGLCLNDCEYGMVYVRPETVSTAFGGIILLEQEIDRVEYGNGASTPVNAILSIAVVPAYDAGQFVSSTCERQGKYTPGLFAIAHSTGYEDEELYTEIQQAWQANLANETIESVPVAEVACINHCPGGC